MNIAVIGAGYVGLVTAAGLAVLGHRVRVGEADVVKLGVLKAGGTPIHEEGLSDILAETIAGGHLTFHADNTEAIEGTRVVMIALPTPPTADGSANLEIIEGV
ncbi:MAG: UDP-glucose 6-dehydrogenase, partial [Actinomycetota bacterium]|nr:UDP-glucose 6-dehydrogenase [Actinomycetota bacterium]